MLWKEIKIRMQNLCFYLGFEKILEILVTNHFDENIPGITDLVTFCSSFINNFLWIFSNFFRVLNCGAKFQAIDIS